MRREIQGARGLNALCHPRPPKEDQGGRIENPRPVTKAFEYIRGLDNAGKSTAVHQWLNLGVEQVVPTAGLIIHTISDRPPFTIHLWDVGGQRAIRAFWRNYFEDADGLVWVIDSTAPDRWQDAMTEFAGVLGEDRLRSTSIVVLANKQDVPSAMSLDTIQALMAEMTGGRGHLHWQAASALQGEGVNEAFDWLMADIAQRRHCGDHYQNNPLLPQSSDGVNLVAEKNFSATRI